MLSNYYLKKQVSFGTLHLGCDLFQETMELYKRMPINEYKDTGHHQDDFCSNCAQNEYEDVLRNVIARKKKTKNYERHCPSCHCPLERRRFSPSSKAR